MSFSLDHSRQDLPKGQLEHLPVGARRIVILLQSHDSLSARYGSATISHHMYHKIGVVSGGRQ